MTMKPLELFGIPLEGTHLIEASAGTGKTYTIASLYIRLLLEKSLHVREILVVTYTVPATDELKTRIREKIRAALGAFESGRSDDPFLAELLSRHSRHDHAIQALEFALRRFDEAAIFTIHGFCRRVLSEMAFESRSLFEHELITDQADLLKAVVGDFYRLHFYDGMPPELVHYAANAKYTFGFFLTLFRKASLDVTVIPEIEKPGLEPLLASYRRRFEMLRRSWLHTRDEVAYILMNDPGLKRKLYRQDSIPGLLEEMDAYISSEGFSLPLFSGFTRFTSSTIEGSMKKGFSAPDHELFILCDNLKAEADALCERMDQALVWLKTEFFRYVRERLPEKKEQLGLVHFDDLLLKVYRSLSSASGTALRETLSERYRAALIDEFQDTDSIQYEIFKAFFSKSTLFLIGDPKQAIYSFRGADIFTYLNASRHVAQDSRHTLDRNWRSEPGLLEALNHVFSRELPFVFDEISFEPVSPAEVPAREVLEDRDGAPLTIWYVPGNPSSPLSRHDAEKRISMAVAWEVSRLLNQGGEGKVRLGSRQVMPRDIALIVRENSQGRLLKDVLAFCGIPCVISSEENIFDTEEAREMEFLLKAVAQPYSEPLVRAALAGPLFGLDAEEIDSLSRDEGKLEKWIERFRSYHDLWATFGFMRMFRSLATEENVRARLLAGPRGERMLTNFLHLSEILNEASVHEKLGMRGLLKWLNQRRDPAMPRSDEHQLRLESDDDAVKIITVHKSKGLEFPIVFCPFLWGSSALRDAVDIAFHDGEDDYRAFLDVGSDSLDDHRLLAEKELLAENMRLVYVALTRARNRCYLVWGRFNKGESSALSYLFRRRDEERMNDGREALPPAKPDDDTLKRELMERCASREARILVQDLPLKVPLHYEHRIRDGARIACRHFAGKIDRSWRVTSFSSMVSGLGHAFSDADRDALLPGSQDREDAERTGKYDILSFPKGARAGIMIHEIFELLDFQADDCEIRELVREALDAHGFERLWEEALADTVRRVLDVRIGDFSLSSIGNSETLRELEFYLPVARISKDALAKAFRDHGEGIVPPEFPRMVEELRFDEATGYLRGFIDLVFARGEKYYLLDWKSNHLGARIEDYGQTSLDAAMEKSYYILQYHLYSLALHRYLQRRVRGYSYSRNFGGVIYVFIRGVDPVQGRNYGIYRRVPSEGLIRDLSDKLMYSGLD